MTSLILALVLLATLPLSPQAVDLEHHSQLRKHHPSSSTCGPVNQSVSSIIKAFDKSQDSIYIDTKSQDKCVNEQTITVDVTGGTPQDCFTPYDGQGELTCCCSANEDITRNIVFDSDFSQATCPISSVIIEVSLAPCSEMECCDNCGCVGDPHCTSFVNNEITPGKAIQRTFEVCDIRNIPTKSNSYHCGRPNQANKTNKNRCLGTGDAAEDYYFNAGRCEWLPDTVPNWSYSTYGSPCQPKESFKSEMVVYEDSTVTISAILGNRGVVKELVYQNHQSNNANSQLTLNADQDCFKWTNKNGGTVEAESDGKMTVDGVNFQYVILPGASSALDSSHGSTAAENTQWSIQGTDSDAVFMCYGATKNGVSTQSPRNTRFDVTVSQRAPETGESGFCVNGNFTDQCTVFFKDCVDPFAPCDGVEPDAIQDEDLQFLESQATCANLLSESNCASFQSQDGGSSTQQNNYYEVIKGCLIEFCSSFFDDDSSSEYEPPPGSTIDDCMFDFVDFGSQYTQDTYGGTYQKGAKSADAANECNSVKVYYKPEGSSQFEELTALELDGAVAQTKTLYLNTSTTDSDFPKPPQEIKVVQQSCPESCDSTGAVTATIQYMSQCEELLYYATNKYKIESPGGSYVNTKKFGKPVN